MIYELPNGKTINISIEAYLRMTDDDFKYLNEMNTGSSHSDNPFISPDDLEELDLIIDENDDILDIDDSLDIEPVED